MLTILTGPRGVGKTVMLSEFEAEAREHGWLVVSETATSGLVARLAESFRLTEVDLREGSADATCAAALCPIRDQDSMTPVGQVQWCCTATALLQRLAEQDAGILLSIDEIHAVDRAELSQIAAVVQHLIQYDLPIALVVAGLPRPVSDLLNECVSTFLRGAKRQNLRNVPLPEVRHALGGTFRNSNIDIDDHQLDRLTAFTDGYPYLVQLAGYHVFKLAAETGTVSTEDVIVGLERARHHMGTNVLQSALYSLSGSDREYLLRMAEDDGPSSTGTITARIRTSAKQASRCRRRLIDAGVIEPSGHGRVDFAVPLMREFLQEQPDYGEQHANTML